LDFINLSLVSCPAQKISESDLSNISLLPILYHSGYLTIDSETTISAIENNIETKEKAFTLRTPNMEIATISKTKIFKDVFNINFDYTSFMSKEFPSALLNKNSSKVIELVHDLLISISYRQHPPVTQDIPDLVLDSEKIYHLILHVSFLSAGVRVMSENSGGEGRSDITLLLHDNICIVIELKYCRPSKKSRNASVKTNGGKKRAVKGKRSEESTEKRKHKELNAALDRAEEQIRKRDYAGPHRANQYKVVCLALAIRGRTEVAARFLDD
jgi:hypothetical protein